MREDQLPSSKKRQVRENPLAAKNNLEVNIEGLDDSLVEISPPMRGGGTTTSRGATARDPAKWNHN